MVDFDTAGAAEYGLAVDPAPRLNGVGVGRANVGGLGLRVHIGHQMQSRMVRIVSAKKLMSIANESDSQLLDCYRLLRYILIRMHWWQIANAPKSPVRQASHHASQPKSNI